MSTQEDCAPAPEHFATVKDVVNAVWSGVRDELGEMYSVVAYGRSLRFGRSPPVTIDAGN